MKRLTWILGFIVVFIIIGCSGNTKPIATSQNIVVEEDNTKAITLTATDSDGDTLNYVVVTNPSNGTLNGTAPNLTYTPNNNYHGVDGFTFKVSDRREDSNVAIVGIMVKSINDAPKAIAQSINMDKDTTTAITIAGTDVDKDNLTFNVTLNPLHGTLSGTIPNLTYKPNIGYQGDDSFKFIVNDGIVNSVEAIIDIHINSIKDVPILAASIGSISENAENGDIVGSITIVSTGSSPITSMVLSGTGSANFNIATDGTITVSAGASLDYETYTEYNLSVIANNSNGASELVSLNITVVDEDNPFQIDKLIANDAEAGDTFGGSVAISGDYIVVGAPDEGTNGMQAGCAYLFKRNSDTSITQILQFRGIDTEEHDRFGVSVAIRGDIILVGAWADDTTSADTGSVYVFRRVSDTDIIQIAKLTTKDAEASDLFGGSVAINGDYIIVGSASEDTGGSNAGSAYLFKYYSDTNITQIAKLMANDTEADDHFGSSVAIDGDMIVIGADGEDSTGSNVGSAYIFKRNSDTNITQVAQLRASNATDYSYFGYSVAIDGNNIVVGAYSADSSSAYTGGVYIFKYNSDTNISEITQIISDDATPGDNFGISVAIDGAYIIVGAWTDNNQAGSAYIFKYTNSLKIVQISHLTAHDAYTYDQFGNSVAIDGEYTAIGAHYKNNNDQRTGSVYLFKMEPIDQPYIYNKPNSTILHDEELMSTSLWKFDSASPSGDAITYTLDGIDSPWFSIYENNLSFDPKANYETPQDDDNNNEYNFTVTASDTRGNDTTVAIDVIVKDKKYFELAQLAQKYSGVADYLGFSVAISGDYIIVGAPQEDINGSDAGSAYLFKRSSDDSIIQIAHLTAYDAEADDKFGYSVSINGDYIVVGAKEEDTNGSNAGSTYLFKRNSDTNIVQIAKLTAGDAQANDYFGHAVSISGDYIIVGAMYEDTGSTNTGCAYLFKRNSDTNIVQIAKLNAMDIQENDYFGVSVGISGDYIAIGAHGEDTRGSNAGSAYIFKRNSDTNITQISQLFAENAGANDYFGASIAISGDYIIVGAYLEDTVSTDAGSAYLFKYIDDTHITQIVQLNSMDSQAEDRFGYSVAISGDNIIVGANGGATYLFRHISDTNTSQIAKITAKDTQTGDKFGYCVAISGDYIIVGAHTDDVSSTDSGSAYLFKSDNN